MPVGTNKPRNCYVRSNDGHTFYVYIDKVSNEYAPYYVLTPIHTGGSVTFERMGVDSMDDGSVLDATAQISNLTVNGSSVSICGSVTTAKWGTARTITVADNSNTNKQTNADIDGSANFTLKLPATIKASLTGNANTATLLQNRGKTSGNTAVTTDSSLWTP